MVEESERELQDYFIELLVNNGYEQVTVKNENDLISNFKKQLKSFNRGVDFDFKEVLDYLYRGDRDLKFDKLRSSFNGVKFIDFSDFSNNIFQVSEEISVVGDYSNRYDVTILINGLPLVQIELKKSGVGLKEAFNQIQRYSNHSYSRLFDLVQIFIISNKVNTKYFFNDSNFNYSLAGNWGEFKDITSFTNSFLIKDNLMKILSRYIFKNAVSGNYQMLRPYQISAVEGVMQKIKERQNGYVWMSHNTGKSTTALRLAEMLKSRYKTIYITGDYLFKYPKILIANDNGEFLDVLNRQNLIITNISSIMSQPDSLKDIRDDEYIFIFDEYEKRSLKYNPEKLMKIFTNSLFYCFTSAPVFDENIIMERTTKSFFTNRISTYTLKDAIRDKTNMILDCEYIGDESISYDYNLSSDVRIGEISSYIVSNIKSQAVLIASSNEDLIRYYEHLKKSQLKVVPILRHASNDIFDSKPMRDYFEEYIHDYNRNFDADIQHRKVVDTSDIMREFEEDVIKRFNLGKIDLLIVDETMLYDEYNVDLLGNLRKTSLNTLYLDCNLNYDTLFEALMMVGEVDHSNQKQAHVKILRDITKNIQKTIKLYSNNKPGEDYTLKDYDYYLERFNHYKNSASNDLIGNFKRLSHYYHILKSFEEFDFTKSQNDEYNSLKDQYEHEIYRRQSGKKTILKYNPDSIDEFFIDLNYIDGENIDEKPQEDIKNDTFNILNETNNNITYEENTNALSFQKHDNSQKLSIVNNNQDLSSRINIKNEYHIHVGGDNIKKIDNAQSKLEDGKNQEKICLSCQETYPENFNYCPQHEEDTELVYVKDLTKICSSCGSRFPQKYNYCPNCDSKDPLTHIYQTPNIISLETYPNRYFNFYAHSNRFSEIEDLMSAKNIDKLYEFNLNHNDFDNIIENIKITNRNILESLIEDYHIDVETLTALEKILLYSKSFVKTEYKEGGGDLGYFKFNEIHIDDRATKALQITTIIHELSHFILSEIFEQIVSLLLDTDKTDAVEAFVCYQLCLDEFNYVVDEYCAHTVEGRFATYGYQDYSSYNQATSRLSSQYSPEHVEIARSVGNTFADYIKDIMTSYIDYDLREEIKDEFTRINDLPKYSVLKLETSGEMTWELFSNAIKIMLTKNIRDIQSNQTEIDKLNEYAFKFKINNQGN